MPEDRQPAVPILRSKLYRPPFAADLVVREELLARLEAGRRLPLTLVSAPAGYGKTTLVSHWLETCELPSAWLSLDETDGDLGVFLHYFVAAVRTLFPDACRDSLALLNAPELPPAPVLAGCLSNDLDRVATDRVATDAIGEPFVLALDDYHRIAEPAIHDLLDHLLAHPPRGLHLAILSRRDPTLSLLALRSHNQLTEIRMGDLQLTPPETASFLEGATGRRVDGAALQRLQESTEGWALALRLAALALQHNGATFASLRDDDVDALARGITGDSWQAEEFLVTEILSHQTPAVREWLCKTSILDRFCAPLCEAICRSGEGGGALSGREFIRILEARGLFCVALDERREWYRTHHLFQEVLQRRLAEHLGREEMAALHARAAAWFEAQGLLEEAIRHLLEGEGPAAAGLLMARHRNEIMNREQWHRLDRWLRWLPPEVAGENPELLVLKAWLLHNRGRYAQSWAVLDRVEARVGESPRGSAAGERLRGEIDALRSYQRIMEGRGDLAVRLAERALDLLPEECLSERGFATVILAGSHQICGDLESAHSTVYDALAGDPPPSGTYHARLLAALCFVHWMEADLPALLLAASRYLELGDDLGLAETSMYARYFLGIAQYHACELAAAEATLAPVVADRIVPSADFFAHCAFALAAVYEAQGRRGKARETARSVVEHMLRTRNQPMLRLAQAFQAELASRQGRIAEAVAWAQQVEPGPFRPFYLFYAPEMTLAKVLLAEGVPPEGDKWGTAESRDRADDLLTRLEEYCAATHNRRFLIETLALKALLRDAQGDEPAALELLGRAVALAHPGRWRRLFVDLGPGLPGLLHRLEVRGDALRYVGEILATFQPESQGGPGESPEPPAGSQPLPEPLTPRELEILGLLAERLSNREIAEKLFVSPVTVKSHTHNLYEKLGVSGRREVVTKALGLGILGDR